MGVGANVKATSIKHLEDIMGDHICLPSRDQVFKLYKVEPIKENVNNFHYIKIKNFLFFKEIRKCLFFKDTIKRVVRQTVSQRSYLQHT